MKKFLILGALTAATLATPVLAQDYRGYDRGYDRGYNRDRGYDRGYESSARYSAALRTNRDMIEDAMRTGRVDRWEASRIIDGQKDLEALFRRYRANGLSGWERRDLEVRIARIRDKTETAIRSGSRRSHRNWR